MIASDITTTLCQAPGHPGNRWLHHGSVLAAAVPCDGLTSSWLARVHVILSPREQAAAERFRFSGDRASYVAAHALQRVLLHEIAPCRGSSELLFGRYGQPYLPRDSVRSLCVSISHTSGLAACVLGAGHGIGVDVEPSDAAAMRDAPCEWLTAAERRMLNVLAPPAAYDTAIQLWTLKEAFAKAMGLGMNLPFGAIGFKPDPPRLVRVPPACRGRWQFTVARPVPGHVMAVAVRRTGRRPVHVAIEVLSPETLLRLATAVH